MAATRLGRGTPFPLAEGQVRGDRDGCSFFAFGDDLEEELGVAGVDLDAAELVPAKQVQASVAADDTTQVAVLGGFDEVVDQLGGGDVPTRRPCSAGSGAPGGP